MNSAITRRALVALCLSTAITHAASVSDPSTSWVAVNGNYDYLADQQTGQPAGDIVGATGNPGFLTTFNNNGSASNTDGTLGFRMRLDAAGGNTQNPAFDRVAWVGIYDAGNSANTSPSTTSIASSAAYSYVVGSTNYNYRPVNSATDGGTTNDSTPLTTGDPDYYVSFMINFGDLVSFLATQGISITDESALRYVLATSTQTNSLNQDLGGVQGGVNSTLTWVQLGGFSPLITANGTPAAVPEPASSGLAALGLALFTLRRRRK